MPQLPAVSKKLESLRMKVSTEEEVAHFHNSLRASNFKCYLKIFNILLKDDWLLQ